MKFRTVAPFIPVAGLGILCGVVMICKSIQEPLPERAYDIAEYVKHNDGIDVTVLGHTEYAEGGTAWGVQADGNPSVSFTVIDNGLFRTHIVSDDYKTSLTRP
ncbi:hypothetical protein [Alicyclobacillus dauci]|uniref:Beta-lactamase inhibitor (BLIP) n=1 Tax=Alicyclobacillus dauci TaxID=1475485 RepID=A0ABY6Z713_9BACL|nr:hypothetical protein [Alicyclobacillus dauci]WAH38313.1 hypothetical protein NZD86_07470 [Alicyclobacillus dauci]